MQQWVLAEDLGIETVGGVFTPLITQGTAIPCEVTKDFSTAEDGQSVVTISLSQGTGPTAKAARQLGTFDLAGITAAPKGVPRIDVTISVDEEGALSVTAKDRAGAKSQGMQVTANEKHRVKLVDAGAKPVLAEPLNIITPDNHVSALVPRGSMVPVRLPLRVRTTEDGQQQIKVTFHGGAGKPLFRKTFGLKGNQSPAGTLLELRIDVAISDTGTVSLYQRGKSEAETPIFTAETPLTVTTGEDSEDSADPFQRVFGDIFKSPNKPAPFVPKGFEKTAAAGEDERPAQPSPDLSPGPRIFISHATDDAAIALSVVSSLEGQAGRPCWIAPRNVRAGHDYRSEILDAIKACSHFVFLMSGPANASAHVLREVSLADQYSRRIIPIRLDDTPLRSELEYLLHGRHWVRWADTRDALHTLF